MKKVSLIFTIFISLFFMGCSSTQPTRVATGVQIERVSKELDVQLISTAKLFENSYIGISKEGGITLNVTNKTDDVIIINLGHSSMTLQGISMEPNTSRVVSGNDRIKNLGEASSNLILPPKGSMRITLYPSDLMDPQYNGYGTLLGFKITPAFKSYNKIKLLLAYYVEEGKEMNLAKNKYFIANYTL